MKAQTNAPKTARLQKSIEVSKRRIEEYAKKAETYKARFNKHNRFGFKLEELNTGGSYKSRYEFNENLWNEWKSVVKANVANDSEYFNTYYDLKHNADYYVENIVKYERERNNLTELESELNKADAIIKSQADEEENPTGLRKVLIDALADYKVVWFERMRNWYSNRYDKLWAKQPVWVAWISKYNALMNKWYNKISRYYGNHTKLYYRLEEKAVIYRKNLCNRELRYEDKAEFMVELEKDLVSLWKNNMNKLVKKCEKFNIDLDKVEVYNPQVEECGFSVLIRDGKPRVIDVRTIWAAEYSYLFTPHTRYIITERKTKK